MIRSIVSLLVPSFIKRRYAMKFVVSIAFVLLAIGIVGAAGYAEVTTTIEGDARDDLESQATLQADSLEGWTERMGAQTRTVAQIDELQEGEELGPRLDRAKSTSAGRGSAGIYVVDFEEETVVGSTQGSDIESGTPLSAIDEPWARSDLREHLRGQATWISDGSYDSSASDVRRVVAFAVSVEGNSNRAVVLEGSGDVFVNRLRQRSANQSTSIINSDYQYVLQPDEQDRTVVQDEHQREKIDEAIERNEVTYSDHGDHLRAYAPVSVGGQTRQWVAVTSLPKTDAYVVRDTVGRSVAVIIGAALLSLGLVALVLGYQTVPPLSRLRSRAKAMEEGDLDVDLETGRTDEIGQLYSAFDAMRRSLREQIMNAQAARDEAEAERERVREINQSLEQTAAQYSTVMAQAAEGDLTARMPTDVDNDAMAAVALDFNEMLEELEQTVGELNAFAAEVATASEEVTAASEEVRSASEQISSSIQEISTGAERQTDSLQTVNSEMEGLSTTTEEIAASSNEVADIAERTAATGQTGREAAQAAIEEMRAVEGASEQAVEEISLLQEEVGQIDELIERIQEIADQTNMLALNANIEASRSSEGDSEAGFGVVAQEVKELSDDAKSTAAEVEERLQSIREQTRQSVAEVERTSDDVQTASRQVEEAVDALEEIADYAGETHTGVQEISAATEEQAAATEEVVSMVDEATTISEETTAESENVAAAAEQQTTALTEVSRSASDLSEQAARLSEALDRFETDAKLESGPEIRMLEDSPASGAPGDEGDPEPAPAPDDPDEFQPEVEAEEFGADSAAGGAEESDPDDAEPVEGERPTDGGSAIADTGTDAVPGDPSTNGDPTDRTGADVFGGAQQGQPANGDGQAASAGDVAEAVAEDDPTPADPQSLTAIQGVGESKAQALREAGYETVDDLREADLDDLAAVSGFGQALAEQVKEDLGA